MLFILLKPFVAPEKISQVTKSSMATGVAVFITTVQHFNTMMFDSGNRWAIHFIYFQSERIRFYFNQSSSPQATQ